MAEKPQKPHTMASSNLAAIVDFTDDQVPIEPLLGLSLTGVEVCARLHDRVRAQQVTRWGWPKRTPVLDQPGAAEASETWRRPRASPR
jgi:hypothetical protein